MYTVKRIIDGDTSGSFVKDWLVSEKGGKTYKEAIALARNPTPLDPIPFEHITAPVSVDGTENPTQIQGEAYYIAGVTVIRGGQENGADLVLTGANPGSWLLEQATHVLVTNEINENGEMEVSYDFIYPNEELYITDRFGNTVKSVRKH